jgi:LuxR family transcriptional regulator, maltose regulon positive regulatory protein
MIPGNLLLETKLFVPMGRRALVGRPRLSERLNAGAQSKLTLVSAPAGFGKTTLLAEWLAAAPAQERSAAWVSLDQTDNHAASFWSYIVAALQRVEPGVATNAISLLQSSQPPPTEAILAALLNEFSAISHDVVLVLDDYHLIDARDIHSGMLFLLDHLPPRMHLVIASRADPVLPLARLRARGELLEIRAADLRFTPDEAAAYLNEVMGLHLTAQDVGALEARTEGWIAALQLAALSMQGRDDVASFIAGFAGDDRYIVDYLVEEVLQIQPADVRNFLLQTSILDRLSGPLCDAVTGQAGGKAMLEALDRANLFVIPLDDRRRWYRYHHLFAGVVHTRLTDEQPDAIPDLHRRASEWYEHNGEQVEAIRHALAADDLPKAADLVELALPAMRRTRQDALLLRWLKALPDELVRLRPVLSAGYAGALLTVGELAGVEARLRDAERWLETTEDESARPARMIVVDQEEFSQLAGAIAVYRGAHALALGDVPATTRYARRALDLIPADDHLRRGAAAALLGLASWASGDLETAHRAYSEGMARLRMAGHISDAIGGVIALADIRIAQGRLHEAMSTYEQALQLATERGEPVVRGMADMYVGMSALQREHDDLNRAAQLLLKSRELGEGTGFPQNPYRWRVAMARIRETEGDLDAALALLREADRLYVADFSPNVRPVAAMTTRVWIIQGRLGDALGWAREQGLSAQDDVSYLREYAHITLARLLLAQRSRVDAVRLLQRLLEGAESGGRMGSAIEILVLQSLAQQMQGDISAALVPLERALTLAEPEGYVRMFVDEGPPMAILLQHAAKHGIAPTYVRQLLTAFPRSDDRAVVKQAQLEPLSERELEVLRLLGTDLDGSEIARELVVSLNTMRTHTKNIYNKLGVNSRRAAVRRAEELHLS